MISYIKKKAKDPKMVMLVSYLVFGGLTTLVNLGTYAVLTRALYWEENPANIVAVSLSVLFAYVVNKLFVFKSRAADREALIKEFFSFIGARGLTIALELGGVWLFHTVLGLNDLAVKAVAIVIVIIINFLISKFFVFKNAMKRITEEQ